MHDLDAWVFRSSSTSMHLRGRHPSIEVERPAFPQPRNPEDMKKVDVRGASAKKPSRSPLQSSAKKRKDLRSDRSRERAIRGRWYEVDRYLPSVRSTGGSQCSEYVLCLENFTPAVVCWYDHANKKWEVADHRANSDPVPVKKWTVLPRGAVGYEGPVYLHPATGIAAKSPQPKARTRSGKPGASSSKRSPK